MSDAPVMAAPAGKVIAAPPRRQAQAPGPCSLVIFGAGGDLTKRLLVPALYNLARTKLLPEKFAIVGVDLAQQTVEDWRNSLHSMLQSFIGNQSSESALESIDEDVWNRLAGCMSYLQGDMTDQSFYRKIGQHLQDLAGSKGVGENVIFYLAVADRFFSTIVEHIGKAGLAQEC